MKSPVLGVLTAVAAAVALAGVTIAGQSAAADAHTAAAKKAAGQDWVHLTNLCDPRGEREAGGDSPPARSAWHAEPQKVFDNLYFLGEQDVSSWAITTSDGIILLDAVRDYSVEDEVVQGMKRLGLDPAKIKYLVLSHAHFDHFGGAKFLQDRYSMPVMMTAADWDHLARSKDASKPRKDRVVTDGQKLTLGDTTVTLVITPGHTPGTISMIFPVKDGGTPHVAALWGGTNFAYGGGMVTEQKPRAFWYQSSITSAQHFADAATKAGADVMLSNHPNRDGSKVKLPALKTRKAGEPNPYVVGPDAVKRYLTVVEECAKAGLARLGS
jgi:metallo-beta-lactamase class B